MRSRKLWLSLALTLGVSAVALTGCGQNDSGNLAKPAGKDWPTAGGDWGNTRFSTLKQITTANAKDVGAAWVTKFEGSRPVGTPIVTNGVMFMTTTSDIYALNPKTGEKIWNIKSPHPLHGTYKGSAIGGDMLYVGTGNGRIMGL